KVLLDSMAAEIAAQVQPEVTEPRPLHPYEPPTQYRQSARRKEAIRVVPIARQRTSIVALIATLGLVLIVTVGTLGYRWTHPQMRDEVTARAKEVREAPDTTWAPVPPPTAYRRTLPSLTAADLVNAAGQCSGEAEQAGGIALQMTECEVVRRAGPVEKIDFGT